MREVPNINCYLAGDGEIENVSALIKAKGLEKNVFIMGWLDRNGMLDLLKQVSTVVLPSYNEGLPMAILEEMASGKAIISTKIAAIPEVIKEENGILIQPGDIEALADAMLFCCRNPDALSAMSQTNIRKAEEIYSVRTMHANVRKCFERVLNA